MPKSMRRSPLHLLRFAAVVVLLSAVALAAPTQVGAWAASGVAGFDTARAYVASLVAPAAPAADPTPVEFSGAEAKRHVDQLAGTIGSRPAGSDGQAEAAAYVRDQLAALGYQTELQPFQISSYEDRGSTIAVSGPSARNVAANTLNYSTAGTVEAEIVDVGLGRDGDFDPSLVQGRIALIRRGETRFSEKVETVAAAGAIGAIVYNHEPGNFAGSLTAESRIPAVSVARADGEALLAETQGGPTVVTLAVDAGIEQRTAANVVGTKPGGPETIVIGGHLDSVAAGPGANDNASGIAVMLEAARVMATRPSPYTLKFVAFDAEEIGLRGSAYMVSQLGEAERRATRAMINLDMVGVGSQPRLGGSDELVRIAGPIAASLGETSRSLGDGLNGSSDHASFLRADIPALFLYRGEDPNYHSPNDRAEYVAPENLQYAGGVVIGVLDALRSNTG